MSFLTEIQYIIMMRILKLINRLGRFDIDIVA